MIRYSRAYPSAQLLSTSERSWSFDGADGAAGESLVYVWDDYSVTAEPFPGGRQLVTGDAEEWRRFCVEVLAFSVPADLITEEARVSG